MLKVSVKIEKTLSTAPDEGWIRATIFAAADQCDNSSECSTHRDITSTSGDVSIAFAMYCGSLDFRLFNIVWSLRNAISNSD